MISGEYRVMNKKGKKDFQIRGVFRMDPRFDPTCKPIPDKKTKVSTGTEDDKDDYLRMRPKEE